MNSGYWISWTPRITPLLHAATGIIPAAGGVVIISITKELYQKLRGIQIGNRELPARRRRYNPGDFCERL